MSVILETSLGDLVIDLYYEECPLASKNFLKLCKQKFYNGALFNNMQKNYLVQIQTPNPAMTIYNNQPFEDQFHKSLKHNCLGVVSTANKGQNLNTSDFFILLTNNNLPQLNHKHTVFGQVQEGLEVLLKLNDIHVDDNNRPLLNVRVKHTIILHDPFEDPIQIDFPSRSPSPNFATDGRLEYEEKEQIIDRFDNQAQEELIELAKDQKAKINSQQIAGENPDAEPAKPLENTLYVTQLNAITEEKDLEVVFSKFGMIKHCDIVRDWITGISLQCAFIEFENPTSCQEAYLKLENTLLDDRRIHVDFCESEIAVQQWDQLKKDQRKKRELKQQSTKNQKGKSLIDSLLIKKDYYNQKQNYELIPLQRDMMNEAYLEKIAQKIQKQSEKIGRKLLKKQAKKSLRSRSISKKKHKKEKKRKHSSISSDAQSIQQKKVEKKKKNRHSKK